MRLAVLDTHSPFVAPRPPGARLCEALRAHGHDAVLVRVPFRAAPLAGVVDQVLAMRLLHLDGVDRAVGLRFPAYLVPHEERVLWLFEDGLAALRDAAAPGGAPGVHASVLAADRGAVTSAQRVHAPTAAAAERLERVLGGAVAALPLPPSNPWRFRCEGYGDHVVVFAPACAPSRWRAALEAIARAPTSLRVVVVAPPGAAAQLSEFGLNGRAGLVGAAPLEATRARLVAGARAVVDLAEHLDGPVTIEAFHARKAVLTLAADGGAATLLRDRVSGRVTGSARELAAALEELADDPALAERYGAAGYAALERNKVSWESVVAELTQ